MEYVQNLNTSHVILYPWRLRTPKLSSSNLNTSHVILYLLSRNTAR